MATQVEYSNPEVLYHFGSHELEGDDDEVYQASGGPGSITDIWKKFELIPTPPLSPSRQATSSGASSPICLTSSPTDTLQNASDILDDFDNSRTTPLFTDSGCVNLKSNLIQDCMWGSHSTEKKPRSLLLYDTPCSTPPPAPFLALDYVSSDCVDPTSVFPYHINNHEFVSDSSEDEDEIDVVTIEKPVKRKASMAAELDNDDDDDDDDEPEFDEPEFDEPLPKKAKSTSKRLRAVKETQESAKEMSNRLAAKEKFDEPECKRTVHNVLERKRRNDLKYSFQVLRDSVPELKGSERAPKVAILKKATDCILKLKTQEESLLKQKDILDKRHESLLRKLKSLEES